MKVIREEFGTEVRMEGEEQYVYVREMGLWVSIKRESEGLVCDIWDVTGEEPEVVSSCYALYDDCEHPDNGESL